ncbi:MAG TPA: hypothetical protein ENG59_04510 [Chloroflexi bacterium]|nr:MAG: hypothetical protein DRI46_01685 [Chloroflexota bacterium]HDD55484.1 hypothetical protein [Chloroflexota bacterium]
MARKLAWRDLTVLHRYQNQRMVLDNSLRFVFNPGLFSSVLLSVALPSSEFYAAADPLESEQFPLLIGQILFVADNHTARIAMLAPSSLGAEPDYSGLISHLSRAACERGALQMMGEVGLGSPEEQILHQSGFRSYTEQQIWKLPRQILSGSGQRSWVPASRGDNGLAQVLYQRVVPAQIQRLEPLPDFPKIQGMLSWKDGRVVGIALTQFGPRGILLDLLLDPSLGSVDEYLSALLFHLPYTSRREVYLRVRDYQQVTSSALERLGALPGDQQRVMVKRLAVHYNAQQTFVVQGFEKQPDITTPISHTKIKN